MTPILILVIALIQEGDLPVITTEQIQFRTIGSCEFAAQQLERELSIYNAKAICIDRSIEQD